jgi:PhnB protein
MKVGPCNFEQQEKNMLLTTERIPNGYNNTNQFVIVKGGATNFIEFVTKIFGAKERVEARTPDRDGLLIHAEVALGNATLMLADSKDDWPFTPAFIQVYVQDAQATLDRATTRGAELVTKVSKFYGGFKLARFKDPFGNIWWLYQPDPEGQKDTEQSSNTDWHHKKPSEVYITIVDAMKNLTAPGVANKA